MTIVTFNALQVGDTTTGIKRYIDGRRVGLPLWDQLFKTCLVEHLPSKRKNGLHYFRWKLHDNV